MQAHYPPRFERDMACTEAEWLARLPQALGAHAWQQQGASARVRIGEGTLDLAWRQAPPRRIALLQLARLHVAFSFVDVDDDVRHAFMRRFDLYLLRGGG